jgi:AcrR family transcriptional regulator
MPVRRMTREQRRVETRERLLAAAREVFASRGYHAASVEHVADRAGFSTGAVYSAFGSKEELFLALLERELRRHTEQIELAIRDRPSVDDRVRGAAEHWMSFVEREPRMVLLFTEFWAYAVRDRRARANVAGQFGEIRAALARLIATSARDLGLELTIPVEQLAVVVDALADGIARHKLADPDAVPDDLFARALGLVFAGASRPAGA